MSRLDTHEGVRDFLQGGHAIFTLSNPLTGKHFTYRLGAKRDDESVVFLSVLTGPDNTSFSDYAYAGMWDAANLDFRMTRKSRMGEDAHSIRSLRWFLNRLRKGVSWAPAQFRHEGTCCRCGRKLTTPESVDRGIGPECWAKMMGPK